MQETHFIFRKDEPEMDYILSAFVDSFNESGVSLLNGRSQKAEGGRLVVADVAVKGFKFLIVAV